MLKAHLSVLHSMLYDTSVVPITFAYTIQRDTLLSGDLNGAGRVFLCNSSLFTTIDFLV